MANNAHARLFSRDAGAGAVGGGGREKSYFEQQRDALVDEIAVSFEHVLASVNKLNRSLEAVIAVGNEFSSVEALWSQFEGVMAKEEPLPQAQQNQGPESQRRDEGVKREEAGGRGGSVRESREGNGEGEDEDVKMEGD